MPLFNTALAVLNSFLVTKGMEFGKEKVTLLIHNMIPYYRGAKNLLTEKQLQLTGEFDKIAVYKINIQNSTDLYRKIMQ